MQGIAAKLKRSRLFAHMTDAALAALLANPGPVTGDAGTTIEAVGGDLVVLLAGGLVMRSDDGGHLAALAVDDGAREPAILYTIPAGARLQLTLASTYLVVEGDRIDAALSAPQQARSLAQLDEQTRARLACLLPAAPFRHKSLEQLCKAVEVMQPIEVAAGADVVRQGEPGDYFYVIESGRAEVLRQGAAGREHWPERVAVLGPSSTFGEEALLQESVRNATVRMLEDGRLLRLGKADFDRLLKEELLHVMAPADARTRLERRAADLIDCRTEEEWELYRLPGARLIPLDVVRERGHGLARGRTYIVYCRTGRRSAAAAFLFRQMGLDAWSLAGGLAAWPYAIEGGVMDL